MTAKPAITIIIPAYNEELSISSCITAIKNQTYQGSFEIVVVDNNSNDNTARIALDLGCRVIHEPKQGYIHAIRRGFNEAAGDIIACTDADTLVSRDWLERIVANLEKPGVVGCSGSFLFSDGPVILKLIGFLFGRCNWHLAGANMAVWKWAFQKVGGFSNDINLGADVELGLRLNTIGKVRIDRRLVVKTSARRFQCAFWRTIMRYYVNDLCLLLFRRPLFYRFANYRLDSIPIFSPAIHSVILTSFVIFFLIPLKNASTGLGDDVVYAQKSMKVALTFDDGPSKYTERILDILAEKGVRATFFVIGSRVEKNPETARRIVDEGHAIGNHSYSHFLWPGFKNEMKLSKEIDKTQDAIRSVTGFSTMLFRPPHGWRSARLDKVCREKDLTQVLWTIDPHDWQHPSSATIVDRILPHIAPGAIILLHDGLELKEDPQEERTVEALPAIIDSLEIHGYDFITIPEMIEENQFKRMPLVNAH